MIISELIVKYENLAIEMGLEESSVKLLLSHLLGVELHEVFARIDESVEENDFKVLFDRYAANYPVQYITNTEYFYGFKFYVDERVLIPRFETEELVSYVLDYIDEMFDEQEVNCCDIGTGSGAIAISLSLENQNLNFIATDISFDALDVARLNNQNLGANVQFLQGDMLKPLLEKKFDVVLSNPPYIPKEEDVDSLVLENEPHVALFGGVTGVEYYEIILRDVDKITNDRYLIAFEIGFDQAERISKLIEKYLPKATYEIKKDLQNKDRMIFIRGEK